ncbi:LacI family DNA-binding transcriptional regulator [Jeotgalibacillus soli]|uniref:DNA-binding protein n=1 Tax=Jeotgalibacillus soli TaxID=889306 RepID=A0A0C2RI04_9BACL|nr:LacI family DNA-binding transcriptional regulator [Jeotgalibacillus soli]KIL49800.1 DNA-binding protein [Jeotgalibacillus soli]
MATIKDIAEIAKVSRTTVSRVINDTGYVSDDARERVLQAIKRTGYIPSEYAKSLRTKQTKVIGVILPKISTETVSRMVSGITEELSHYGYQVLLANTNLDPVLEIDYLKLLKARQVDGIILVATNVSDALIKEIHKLTIPFAVLGQEIPGVTSIHYDDYQAAYDITRHVIKKGHTSIGFIGVPEADQAVGYERKRAFIQAMRDHALPLNEHWIQEAKFDIDSGNEAIKRMFESRDKLAPTAVIAVTDRLAIGAMQYLKERGLSIPHDIGITGMGNSELSRYVTPPLTTIHYHYKTAGEEVARIILDKIDGKNNDEKKSALSYRLIERDSL